MTAPRFDQATRIKMLEAGVWQRGDGSLIELRAMPDGHLVNALLRAYAQKEPAAITDRLCAEVVRRNIQDVATEAAARRMGVR